MVTRRKAPAGCYWRGDTLWGRIRKDGRDIRWSLETDDPKVAAERYKAGKGELIAIRRGDAKLAFHNVVEDWAAHWLLRNKSAETTERYLCSMGQLARFLEGRSLSEIDGKLVADIIRMRSKEGVTNATIKRDLVALSSVMNYAIGQGWLEVNPVLPRMKLIEERRDPIVLPTVESVRLVTTRSPGMIADLIRVALATGAREDELVTARCDQFDRDRKQLTIIGKRNKRRTIDLEPFDGHALIGALPSHGPWLFWHSDGENYKNFASQFVAIVHRVSDWAVANNVPFRPFRFHDLRHLHAVNWLKDGRSIYVLQRRLGHASIKTTELYCEFLTPEEDLIVKGLSGHKIGHIGQKLSEPELTESLM